MRDLSSDGVFRCTLWKVDDLCNVALPLWIQSPNWKRLCEHCLLYSSLCWTLLMTSCKTVQLFSNAVLLHSRYLSPGKESTGVTNISIILLLPPGYRGVMQQFMLLASPVFSKSKVLFNLTSSHQPLNTWLASPLVERWLVAIDRTGITVYS